MGLRHVIYLSAIEVEAAWPLISGRKRIPAWCLSKKSERIAFMADSICFGHPFRRLRLTSPEKIPTLRDRRSVSDFFEEKDLGTGIAKGIHKACPFPALIGGRGGGLVIGSYIRDEKLDRCVRSGARADLGME